MLVAVRCQSASLPVPLSRQSSQVAGVKKTPPFGREALGPMYRYPAQRGTVNQEAAGSRADADRLRVLVALTF